MRIKRIRTNNPREIREPGQEKPEELRVLGLENQEIWENYQDSNTRRIKRTRTRKPGELRELGLENQEN